MTKKESIKSRDRVVNHGEVFTSETEVRNMLDMVKHETERVDSRFFEPACGTGNFLLEVLLRKFEVVSRNYSKSQIEYDKYMLLSVSSIYGVELLLDNTIECQTRLYKLFKSNYTKVSKKEPSLQLKRSVKYILERNILNGDALTLLDALGEPILFSEWSLVLGRYIKRRDFKLSEMLSFPPIPTDDIRINVMDDLLSEISESNLVVRVHKEYQPIEFERVYEQENSDK